MIRKLVLLCVCGAFTVASAQKTPVWRDASVNQQNREPRRAHFFAFENEDKAKGDKKQSNRYLSMEGKWKFNFVKNAYDKPENFFALDFDDSKWVDFPVPGLFEMNGYGESHDSEANIRCLLDKLALADNRRARFRTAIALVKNGEEHLFEGIVEGEILREKKGTDGFGYDPIFAPLESGCSFAEMGPQEKNRISHRGRATQKLAAFLRLLLCLLLLSPLSFAFSPQALWAQEIGQWQVYPSYCISTHSLGVGSKVYSLANGNLLAYDTEDTSVRTYNSLDDLNDIHIAHMAYSQSAKRLILVYENCNIDLLSLDDEVVNIASLKSSTLSNKTVNHVFVDAFLHEMEADLVHAPAALIDFASNETPRKPLIVHETVIQQIIKDFVFRFLWNVVGFQFVFHVLHTAFLIGAIFGHFVQHLVGSKWFCGTLWHQQSILRSPSLIHPIFLRINPKSQVRTAGNTKQTSNIPIHMFEPPSGMAE